MSRDTVANSPLWTPSPERQARTNMTAFMRLAAERWDVSILDYEALYKLSIDRSDDFWRLMWEFGGIVGAMGERTIANRDQMPGARYFPDARLNFAENLLRRRDGAVAIIFNGEGRVHRTITYAQLFQQVTACAAAFRAAGIRPGDRVGGYLPNLPEAIVAALGAATVGAVWSSCSPDFGVRGVLDRFGQIAPRILVAADGYFYAGRTHDCLAKLTEVVRELPSVERTVIIPYASASPAIDAVPNGVSWSAFTDVRPETSFERFDFNHPLYVLYSSGTTGVPKCIVHGAGGTLIQHLKEHKLHCDIKRDDRVFYFTTCGWMMWNWLVSALASEATIVLYDGSPFHPDARALFDLADEAAHDVGAAGDRCEVDVAFDLRVDEVEALGRERRSG